MPVPAETIKKGIKLKAIEGSQAVQKHTNSRKELLYNLLGGRLIYRPIKPIIKYPKELVKFPMLLVVAVNCLWKATGLQAWIRENY